MIYSSTGHFQLWDYRVSHRLLLLRSPISPNVAENTDIIFWDVKYLQIPSALSTINIARGDRIISDNLHESIGKIIDPDNIFVLISFEHKFIIASAGLRVYKNRLDIFDSSLSYFSRNEPEHLGELICNGV